MLHACLPCASLRQCGKVVSYDAVSDWKDSLSCSTLLSGSFLHFPHRLSACSSFSLHALLCLTPFSLGHLRAIPSFLLLLACFVLSRCATRGQVKMAYKRHRRRWAKPSTARANAPS